MILNNQLQGKPLSRIPDEQYRHSAIMRGAVLHGLGLNMIKERVMRRSYGIEMQPEFNAAVHPTSLKFVDKTDGMIRCKEVMHWFAVRARPFLAKMVNIREIQLQTIWWNNGHSFWITKAKISTAVVLYPILIGFLSVKRMLLQSLGTALVCASDFTLNISYTTMWGHRELEKASIRSVWAKVWTKRWFLWSKIWFRTYIWVRIGVHVLVWRRSYWESKRTVSIILSI